MNERNTKQKNIILDVIKNNRCHPTMKEIYDMVYKVDPSVGQATVYRYVNSLTKKGKLKKLSINDDIVRYDINVLFHYHLKCKVCGKIINLYDDSNKFKKYVEDKYDVLFDDAIISLYFLFVNYVLLLFSMFFV